MQLREFQDVIGETYLERDRERGVAVTIAWLAEEVGELARAVRKGTRAEQVLELGDVLAWIASLANQLDIDFDEAVGHFINGCPKCGVKPCACP
jgi:NTP pyrophosphatase (non-canonical NTP hydrolase)